MNRRAVNLIQCSGRSSARRAFTLVELVTTMAVLAVIGTIASRTIMSALDGYLRASTGAQLHAELSIAMEQIERELRNIPATSGGSPQISAITSSSIVWGNDSTVALSNGRLRHSVSGGASMTLLEDVTAFSIQAFDESNAALAANLSGSACEPVRRLAVQITVERGGVSQSLRGKVFLRSTIGGGA